MIKGEGRLCNSEAPGVIYTIQRFYPTAPGYLSPSSRHPAQSCYGLDNFHHIHEQPIDFSHPPFPQRPCYGLH